jgi:hypothetical protein
MEDTTMKRLTTLVLLVFALAAVPAAFADDSTPATSAAPAPAAQQQPGARGRLPIRLEILRLRMQIVSLRFRLHCGPNGHAPADKCTAFAQKVEDRLTKIDGNVQSKLDQLKACTATSTDGLCKNADKKIALLTAVDNRLQTAIQKVQDWLNGKSDSSSPSTSDSALDQAANQLTQAAGSNG